MGHWAYNLGQSRAHEAPRRGTNEIDEQGGHIVQYLGCCRLRCSVPNSFVVEKSSVDRSIRPSSGCIISGAESVKHSHPPVAPILSPGKEIGTTKEAVVTPAVQTKAKTGQARQSLRHLENSRNGNNSQLVSMPRIGSDRRYRKENDLHTDTQTEITPFS